MNDKYILIGQMPVPCEDLLEWARWHEDSPRPLFRTRVLDMVDVSTIFTGLDTSYHRLQLSGFQATLDYPAEILEEINRQIAAAHRPLLFETMAFWRGSVGDEQERCATWLEAEAQHWKMVRDVARPPAVLAYVRRMAAGAWEDARRDWKRQWRDFRGIAPTKIESMMERMSVLSDARWQ